MLTSWYYLLVNIMLTPCYLLSTCDQHNADIMVLSACDQHNADIMVLSISDQHNADIMILSLVISIML